MKISQKIVWLVIMIVILLIGILVIYNMNNIPSDQLSYQKDQITFFDFFIDSETVTFINSIVVKNNSKKNLYFYIYADMSEDVGLIKDSILPACEFDSRDKKKYYLKAGEEKELSAYFKGAKGIKDQKYDREPPEKVTFEVIE